MKICTSDAVVNGGCKPITPAYKCHNGVPDAGLCRVSGPTCARSAAGNSIKSVNSQRGHSRRLAELKVSAMRRLDCTVYLASTTNVPLTAGRELRRLGTLNSMTFCTVPASGPLKRW